MISRQPVFVFPGQGAQWVGMAAKLLESSEVFRRRVEECAQALAVHVDWSLLDVLRRCRARRRWRGMMSCSPHCSR